MLFVFGTSFVQSLSTELPFGKLEAIIVGGITNKFFKVLVLLLTSNEIFIL